KQEVMQSQKNERIEQRVKIANWQYELFRPHRYKIIYGGRGSGKSYAVADTLLFTTCVRKCLILCGREFQNSIKDSVHSLIRQRIEANNLNNYFDATHDEIRNVCSESRFIFKGLRHNIDSIKSTAGISHLWIEEADTLSAASWKVIKPTIREDGSEIWATFNPKNKTDILYQEFIASSPPPDSYVIKVNWSDNRHFPQILKQEMEYDKTKDYGLYQHVWEGELLEHSHAQVFKDRWVAAEFEEPKTIHKYFGLDFGFSEDPTAGIRCYVSDNSLYITHEAVKKNLEIDETGKFLEERLPDLRRHTIYADNARPESISFIKRQGYSIRAVKKGKGTVEDGIEYIKAFDQIIINPKCVETIKEFTLYSYKIDERSGQITNIIEKGNDHLIDALRYALENCMKRSAIDYSKWKYD
ncbi:MAG: PBSX family phage terminase large subunit, partial [Janthinobacterium lividum]